MEKYLRSICWVTCFLVTSVAMASQHRGRVTFQGMPVPGVTVTATQGKKSCATVSDQDGYYAFTDLSDGQWKIDLRMSGFAPLVRILTIGPAPVTENWELKILSAGERSHKTNTPSVRPEAAARDQAESRNPETPRSTEETDERRLTEEQAKSNQGFLVNGSVNNAATSQFTLSPAFGNNRNSARELYTGGLALVIDISSLDARPYSLTGENTQKANYNKMTAIATLGGPLKIPQVLPRGPNFSIIYQWARDGIATTESGLVPTLEERSGVFPGGNISSISPVARALLKFYPLPNVKTGGTYNFQTPIIRNSHRDSLQTRLDQTIGRRDQFYGGFAFRTTRSDASNIFSFLDTTHTLGINANVNWDHRLSRGLLLNTGYRFSWLRSEVTPFFANRSNVSGEAGIAGNNQDPPNWGPPTLVFSSGIASLTDINNSDNRSQTDAIGATLQWHRGRHTVNIGSDLRLQQFNYFSQQEPRGVFTFTGTAAGGTDFGDFLNGVPDTSSVAFGNPDKYLRQSVYDAYVTDDWRIRPELTVNIGIRWEYGAPITEIKNRLVNLDVAQNFTAVAPVLASNPVGPLTGHRYPRSLLRPDRDGIEPRLGLSWRPIAGSSVVLRAGYGIYYDTSVYQNTALSLSQESPLSKNISVQNSSQCPQTLMSGFNPCSSTTTNTFAVDPNFRVGNAQVWQLSAQRDLPAALQVTGTYLGVKGTRGVQEFLPNTYPLAANNPCPLCPRGFAFRTSNGNSTREAGSLEVRRRLRSGFTATVQYTFSKSLDDDSIIGGQGPIAAGATGQSISTPTIAQNWLDLQGERGLSTFDQRHLLTSTVQYTAGMGIGGGALLNGRARRFLKGWTALGQLVAGSGFPETPIYQAAVPETGFSDVIRPDRIFGAVAPIGRGHFLNSAAYTAPKSGEWGDAGRGSITGPGQFTFNASLSRTLRIANRYNFDFRIDASNVLNHVVFSGYHTTLNQSPQGGVGADLEQPGVWVA